MSDVPFNEPLAQPAPDVYPTVETKPTAKPPIERLQYLECYRFVFSSPQWMMNLLLGSVCMLIPIVGQIVFVGYEFELFEALRRGRRSDYADFNFDRFSDYLKRGVWPWLVAFLASFVIQVPLILVTYACAVGGALAVMSQSDAGYVTAAVLAGVAVLAWLMAMCFGLALTPFFLRAGLMQEFGPALDFAWARKFIRIMWFEQLLVAVFFTVTSAMWMMLGELMCFIGIYPALTVVSIASIHILWQLYEIYLSRGGEPIPIKQPD